MIKRLYIFNIRRRTIEIIFLPGGAWLHLQIATFNETEAHRGKTVSRHERNAGSK